MRLYHPVPLAGRYLGESKKRRALPLRLTRAAAARTGTLLLLTLDVELGSTHYVKAIAMTQYMRIFDGACALERGRGWILFHLDVTTVGRGPPRGAA